MGIQRDMEFTSTTNIDFVNLIDVKTVRKISNINIDTHNNRMLSKDTHCHLI